MWLLLILMVVSSFSLLSDLGEAKPYNNRFSFSKALDAKMKCYPYRHKMGWLKGYMNFFLPAYLLFLVFSLTDNIYNSQFGTEDATIVHMILQGAQIAIIIVNIIFLRDINKTSYWINFFTCIFVCFCFVAPSIVTIIEDLMMGNTNDAAMGLVLTVITSILLCGVFGGTIAYFHVRKELFMKTEAELHREYGSIED